MKELLKYHLHIYFKSNKFVMPFAALIIFLCFSYMMPPAFIVNSYTLSAVAVFFGMIWVGITYNDIEEPIAEQILILNTNSEVKYYLSKKICLLLLGCAAGLFMVVFPIVVHIVVGFGLFTRPLQVMDIVCGAGLHIGAAFLGAMLGTFLHPRIMKDRKMAVMLTFLAAIMSLVKAALYVQFPISKYVGWIFPPVAEFIQRFTNEEFFNGGDVLISLLTLSIYAVVLAGINIFFLRKKKF